MSYFQGQGKVYLALRNAAGLTGGYTYIGDVSEFKVDFTQKFDDVRENTSGSRQIAAHILTESDGKITLTMQEFTLDNLVRGLTGTQSGSEASGSATAEAHKAFQSTSSFQSSTFLTRQNVSTVVVKKGVTVLVAGTDYNVDLVSGRIDFLAASTIIIAGSNDITVDYAYSANAGRVDGLMSGPREYSIRLDGFNNADAGSRVSVEVFRAAMDLTKTVDFLGSKHADLMLMGTMLQDLTQGVGNSAFLRISKQNV
jgi:hypothetical protein